MAFFLSFFKLDMESDSLLKEILASLNDQDIINLFAEARDTDVENRLRELE